MHNRNFIYDTYPQNQPFDNPDIFNDAVRIMLLPCER